jgi:hypothetical protein
MSVTALGKSAFKLKLNAYQASANSAKQIQSAAQGSKREKPGDHRNFNSAICHQTKREWKWRGELTLLKFPLRERIDGFIRRNTEEAEGTGVRGVRSRVV